MTHSKAKWACSEELARALYERHFCSNAHTDVEIRYYAVAVTAVFGPEIDARDAKIAQLRATNVPMPGKAE